MQTRELFMALAMGPIAGFRWDPVTEHDLLTMAVDVQSAAFAPPIYFPGTTWYACVYVCEPSMVCDVQAGACIHIPVVNVPGKQPW